MKKILLIVVMSFLLISNPFTVKGLDEDVITINEVANYGWIDKDVILAVSEYDQIMLDGIEVSNGYILNEIGPHVIEFYNEGLLQETKRFTITPRFNINFDDVIFDEMVEIELENDGELYVNDKLMSSKEEFEDVGNYDVHVKGVGSYFEDYTFTIEHQVLEFLNGLDYHFDVEIDIEHLESLTVNGFKTDKSYEITKIGHYQIDITGVGNYSKTYRFTREQSSSYLADGKTYHRAIIVNNEDLDKVYINGKEVDDVTYIKKVGHHTIVITGVGDYRKTFKVTLEESFLDTSKTYDRFQYVFKDFEVLFNDKEYTSNDEIFDIGYHKITIKGMNDYENEYELFVHHDVQLPNDEIITETFTLDTDFKKEYVNGILREDYRFSKSGDYEITLVGEGDYTETFNFTYENPNENIARDILYAVYALSAITLVTVGVAVVRGFKK